MTAHTFTVLEDTPLAGDYRQLSLRSQQELSPSPGPGQYLSVAPAPAVHWPVIKLLAADCLQVLAQVPCAAGTVLSEVRIEGLAAEPDPERTRIALVSAGKALACSIFAAGQLRSRPHHRLTVFAQFDGAVPFRPAPSQILMPACPPEAIAAVPLLDSWNIPSRLASPLEQNGFYHGDIRGLLAAWRQGLDAKDRSELQILGFGEEVFLRGLIEWCEVRGIPAKIAIIP